MPVRPQVFLEDPALPGRYKLVTEKASRPQGGGRARSPCWLTVRGSVAFETYGSLPPYPPARPALVREGGAYSPRRGLALPYPAGGKIERAVAPRLPTAPLPTPNALLSPRHLRRRRVPGLPAPGGTGRGQRGGRGGRGGRRRGQGLPGAAAAHGELAAVLCAQPVKVGALRAGRRQLDGGGAVVAVCCAYTRVCIGRAGHGLCCPCARCVEAPGQTRLRGKCGQAATAGSDLICMF